MYERHLTQSERIYKVLNPNGDPFLYRPEKNPQLDLIGLILWATEGDKTQLSMANGSPHIIEKYLEFLRKICKLREDKITCVIHCHDTVPYQKCIEYWSKITSIPKNRFRKPYIKEDKGGQRKYPYGICRIVCNNIKLRLIFLKRLKELGLPRE